MIWILNPNPPNMNTIWNYDLHILAFDYYPNVPTIILRSSENKLQLSFFGFNYSVVLKSLCLVSLPQLVPHMLRPWKTHRDQDHNRLQNSKLFSQSKNWFNMAREKRPAWFEHWKFFQRRSRYLGEMLEKLHRCLFQTFLIALERISELVETKKKNIYILTSC